MDLNPKVVELVRERAIPTRQGCWDEDIIDGLNACECSYLSSWQNDAVIGRITGLQNG